MLKLIVITKVLDNRLNYHFMISLAFYDTNSVSFNELS